MTKVNQLFRRAVDACIRSGKLREHSARRIASPPQNLSSYSDRRAPLRTSARGLRIHDGCPRHYIPRTGKVLCQTRDQNIGGGQQVRIDPCAERLIDHQGDAMQPSISDRAVRSGLESSGLQGNSQ